MQSKSKKPQNVLSIPVSDENILVESKKDGRKDPEPAIDEILKGFSEYEVKLCMLSLNGLSSKQIAQQLNMSHNEIGVDVNRVRAKLQYRVRHLRLSKRAKLNPDKVKRSNEAKLVNKIKTIFPAETRKRYDELYVKFQLDKLTDKEYSELKALSTEFELINAKRLEYIGELAKLRGVSFKEAIQEFTN